MKTEFTLELFNDESTKEKLTMMDVLECMFDDARNNVPDEYYTIVENIELGDKIKFTVEKL